MIMNESKEIYPDNILPDGPTSIYYDDIHRGSRINDFWIAVNSLGLAAIGTALAGRIVPEFVRGVHESSMAATTGNIAAGVILGYAGVRCMERLEARTEMRRQLSFNRKFVQLTMQMKRDQTF